MVAETFLDWTIGEVLVTVLILGALFYGGGGLLLRYTRSSGESRARRDPTIAAIISRYSSLGWEPSIVQRVTKRFADDLEYPARELFDIVVVCPKHKSKHTVATFDRLSRKGTRFFAMEDVGWSGYFSEREKLQIEQLKTRGFWGLSPPEPRYKILVSKVDEIIGALTLENAVARCLQCEAER